MNVVICSLSTDSHNTSCIVCICGAEFICVHISFIYIFICFFKPNFTCPQSKQRNFVDRLHCISHFKFSLHFHPAKHCRQRLQTQRTDLWHDFRFDEFAFGFGASGVGRWRGLRWIQSVWKFDEILRWFGFGGRLFPSQRKRIPNWWAMRCRTPLSRIEIIILIIMLHGKSMRIFDCSCLGSPSDTEPIFTNGRVYFNMSGDICPHDTKEKYTLLVILACDYSSHTAVPVVLMPYVSCCSANALKNGECYGNLYRLSMNRRTISAHWQYSITRGRHVIHLPAHWIRIRAQLEIRKPITSSIWCRWVNTISKYQLMTIRTSWSTYANQRCTLSMKCVRQEAAFAWSTPMRKFWRKSECKMRGTPLIISVCVFCCWIDLTISIFQIQKLRFNGAGSSFRRWQTVDAILFWWKMQLHS